MSITMIPIHPDVAALLLEQERELQEQAEEIARLTHHIDELGRKNIALAAEAERAEIAEQQLAVADERIRELEAALVVYRLPPGSRDNVIQMVREAA